MRYYRVIEDKIGIIVELEKDEKPVIYCEKSRFRVKTAPV